MTIFFFEVGSGRPLPPPPASRQDFSDFAGSRWESRLLTSDFTDERTTGLDCPDVGKGSSPALGPGPAGLQGGPGCTQ